MACWHFANDLDFGVLKACQVSSAVVIKVLKIEKKRQKEKRRKHLKQKEKPSSKIFNFRSNFDPRGHSDEPAHHPLDARYYALVDESQLS
jgi:hypothetical protein